MLADFSGDAGYEAGVCESLTGTRTWQNGKRAVSHWAFMAHAVSGTPPFDEPVQPGALLKKTTQSIGGLEELEEEAKT